ncbi:unnamed protein product [Victoria cruziana]
MASFDCSFEMEPRTLRSEQLDVAREQAVNVFKKETTEEATRIFTKGMKPIEELGRKEMLSGIEERPNVELYASNGDGGEEILEETHIGESLAAPF